MNKFEGTAATMVKIGTQSFVLEGNKKLWALNDGKWKFPRETNWTPFSHGSFFDLCDTPIEIKDSTLGLVYRVSINGFKEVPEVTDEYMLHAIAKKLDLLEYSGSRVYALQEKEKVELGCRELAVILEASKLVTILHRTSERTLYRFAGMGSAPLALLQYKAEIKKAYNKLVPHEEFNHAHHALS